MATWVPHSGLRRYKTEICRTFAATGICPYGTRCRFIHTPSTAPKPSTPTCTAYTPPGTPQLAEGPKVSSNRRPPLLCFGCT